MAVPELGLLARAKGVATHLLARDVLESLAAADDIEGFARSLSHQGADIEPVGEPVDVFAAHQDRRSLRALLRGAAEGAPSVTRLQGLLPTPSLPRLALTDLAGQSSPADVVRKLVLLAHPDSGRLLGLVHGAHIDLLAVDVALLKGFAERAVRIATRGDDALRQFVSMLIDVGNAQNALLMAREPAEARPQDLFVSGGRWVTAETFASATAAESPQQALLALTAALASSPVASVLPVVPTDVARLDRAFIITTLERLKRAARLEPLSTAPLLKVLLLIEAQSLDLRALAWGAAFGTPASVRQQQLVTPA